MDKVVTKAPVFCGRLSGIDNWHYTDDTAKWRSTAFVSWKHDRK